MDPGSFNWERGRGGGGSERPVELFCGKLLLTETTTSRVSQPVNAGRHWRRKYCFASRSAHSYIFKSLWLWRVHKKTVIYDSVDEELQL